MVSGSVVVTFVVVVVLVVVVVVMTVVVVTDVVAEVAAVVCLSVSAVQPYRTVNIRRPAIMGS
jgi:hypothetical protein